MLRTAFTLLQTYFLKQHFHSGCDMAVFILIFFFSLIVQLELITLKA